jgi:putative hydrolase of the HAD superfamily
MSGRTILWGFDGTLATRPGRWSGALLDALDEHAPGHGLTRTDITPHLQTGFPWHTPEVAHPELCEPEMWWDRLNVVLRGAFEAVGCDPSTSAALAATARTRYVDPASYEVYDDVRPVLERLRNGGWRHVVLSNHVPELEGMVEGVGIRDLFDHVITSARIGFDKPHVEAYAHARRLAGDPDVVWMIGDNPKADVRGAEAVGIPAILVRREDASVARQADDLHGALRWLT